MKCNGIHTSWSSMLIWSSLIDAFSDTAYFTPLAVIICGTEFCLPPFTLVSTGASAETVGSGTEYCCSALLDIECSPLPTIGTASCYWNIIFATVWAKTDMFTYKLKFILLPQCIAMLNNYASSLPPLANVNRSASPECFFSTI